jgi:arginase
MRLKTILHLIGYASGEAGVDTQTGDGPRTLQQSRYLTEKNLPCQWDDMINVQEEKKLRVDEKVAANCDALAHCLLPLITQKQSFCVIGGDHASAIGTWSAVHHVYREEGDIGLIWIDAHMDSHTPETTESGRIHGMPLACLLGLGYPTLTGVCHEGAKLKPENICLIGVRSFEKGEAALLKRLNVKVYFMDEVKQRGLSTVMKEAIHHVTQHTVGYGVSLDLDAIDPADAPGVDVPEPDGILADQLLTEMAIVSHDPRLLGIEIVEFNPHRDKNQLTEKLVVHFLQVLTGH